MTEQQYIRYRKLKAFGSRICFLLCRIFPIDRKLVSVCTFEGKGGFGCNPKYVVQALHDKDPSVKFVWLVNPDVIAKKRFPDYIRKVPNTLWSRAYWLGRSAVWIDNYRKPYGTCKRKGQYYLNVNHYTIGIKCTGLWRGSGFSEMARLVSQSDSDMMDGLVIDSKWCEIVSPKGLLFDGPYLKSGAPRCDILHGDRTKQKRKLREKHNLSEDARVVLFAPTFREGARDGKRSVYSEVWSIDFERLIRNLENRFGGGWTICTRVHPQLAAIFAKAQDHPDGDCSAAASGSSSEANSDGLPGNLHSRMFDESQADDLYEILAGCDAYITDYSSACFEAGFAGIPAFIYADDLQQYAKDRGNLMWNLASDPPDHIGNNKEITPQLDVVFPFPVAQNNDELERIVLNYDEEQYRQKLNDFFSKAGLVFTGHASEDLADLLLERMKAQR